MKVNFQFSNLALTLSRPGGKPHGGSNLWVTHSNHPKNETLIMHIVSVMNNFVFDDSSTIQPANKWTQMTPTPTAML